MSRTAKWLQEWHQREMHENDELEGLSWPSFIELVNDIYAYQYVVQTRCRATLVSMLTSYQTNDTCGYQERIQDPPPTGLWLRLQSPGASSQKVARCRNCAHTLLARSHSAKHRALSRPRAICRLDQCLGIIDPERSAIVRGRRGHASPGPFQPGRLARHDSLACLVSVFVCPTVTRRIDC